MTAREREELMEAYNHLVEGVQNKSEFEFFDDKYETAHISAKDYEVLRPFIFATFVHTYSIGDTTLELESMVTPGPVFIDEVGDALITINDYFQLYDLKRAIDIALSSNTPRKRLIAKKGEQDG